MASATTSGGVAVPALYFSARVADVPLHGGAGVGRCESMPALGGRPAQGGVVERHVAEESRIELRELPETQIPARHPVDQSRDRTCPRKARDRAKRKAGQSRRRHGTSRSGLEVAAATRNAYASLRPMEKPPIAVSCSIHWSDMDALGHVNNARYFTWFESARIQLLERAGILADRPREMGPVLATATCDFLRPVLSSRHGGGRSARSRRIGRSSLTTEYAALAVGRSERPVRARQRGRRPRELRLDDEGGGAPGRSRGSRAATLTC